MIQQISMIISSTNAHFQPVLRCTLLAEEECNGCSLLPEQISNFICIFNVNHEKREGTSKQSTKILKHSPNNIMILHPFKIR